MAAKIKRADQRAQGWDLTMHLVRDDLGAEELAALEAQFPGLTARVTARTQAEAVSPSGVQPLQPARGATGPARPRSRPGADGVQQARALPGPSPGGGITEIRGPLP